MNRNWYALGLLAVLAVGLCIAGRFVNTSIRSVDEDLTLAYSCAVSGEYHTAQQQFDDVADKAQRYSPLWMLLVRRNLVDQLNQTLATIPAYATKENQSDLAVETARARTQAEQIRQSFFSWF